jgi:hypothetical protein
MELPPVFMCELNDTNISNYESFKKFMQEVSKDKSLQYVIQMPKTTTIILIDVEDD